MKNKYRAYLWDGTRSTELFTNKVKAERWIRKQLKGWMERGDRIISYELKDGICFCVEDSVGIITDAWATLRTRQDKQEV